jgi:regulation of enolase protein 1 (concanavalin A-like superfamily)
VRFTAAIKRNIGRISGKIFGKLIASNPYFESGSDFTNFVIRCKVSPEFKALYDLGSIVVYDNTNKWIKFAYENSDSGNPAMVSVITDGVSDDCNGEKIYEEGVWMQIIRKSNNFSLHYSKDKVAWTLVRIFQLDMKDEIKLGISAQSPMGDRCIVKFEDLEIMENAYINIRKPD